MGYALFFARKLNNITKKNQLNYQMMHLQNRKTNIANRMTVLQKQIDAMPEGCPTIQFLEFQKNSLAFFDQILDTQLETIKTRLSAISAEEKSVDDALTAQIAASAPKYVG